MKFQYIINTEKYSSFNVLEIGKHSIILGKKEILSVEPVKAEGCKAVKISYTDGTSESKSYAIRKSSVKGVVDNRHRNWRRRG